MSLLKAGQSAKHREGSRGCFFNRACPVGILCLCLLLLLESATAGQAEGYEPPLLTLPLVADLIGEELQYDISFMWFERLATGSISLEETDTEGRYLLTMQAQTRGMAALFSRNRTEKFETLVDIGSEGQLRPLWHSSSRITWRGDPENKRERIARYRFDYQTGTIHYERISNGKVKKVQQFDLDPDNPFYDILSAFYNFRLGFFGPPTQGKTLIPTFHHKGAQEIVVEPLGDPGYSERNFFAADSFLCRVLIDPEVFGTTSRDVYVAFDDNMRLQQGVIKRVVGVGDLRGELVFHDGMTGGNR